MNKLEFLLELSRALEGLPKEEIDEKLGFYNEIIDDKIEDGMSEEDAIAEIGSPEAIATEIIAEYPLPKLVKESVKPKRKLKAWEIVLIILGAPIWLSLGIAAAAVILAIYIVLWSLVVAAWSIFAAFCGVAFGGIVGGVTLLISGGAIKGMLFLSVALFGAGMAIFSFFGCRAATKGMARLTRRIALGIKRIFIRRGEAK